MKKSKLKVHSEKLKVKVEKTTRVLTVEEKNSKSKSSNSKVKSPVSEKKISTKPLDSPSSNLRTGARCKKAMTMDELMARKGSELSVPKRGKIVRGIVTDVTGRMLLVDIGAKTEGMIVEKDFDETRDFIKSLKIGDTVSAYVLSPENDRGQILLSLRSAAAEWQWQKLSEWMRTGEIIDVRGLEVNKGGVVARIDSMDVQGFVPTSQLGGHLAANLEDLVNRVFKAKIIEVDRKNNRLIFSERAVSEQGEITAKKEALRGLKVGMKVTGKIVGLTDFGAFAKVRLGDQEIEGLIHVSELSWDKIDDASSVIHEGDDVTLLVIDVNPDAGKVGFSLKQLAADPWNNIEERYPPGKKLSGVVSKVATFGAIVQLEPGVSGLLHISKIPTKHEPAVGDAIEVVVEDLDAEHRKLALGMAAGEIPVIYR